MNNFTFIDLFSGIGGMRIPFEELGGKCVFSTDIDKFVASTYKLNFGEDPLGDINEIDLSKISDHDILLAGFPCQPFSRAGKMMGMKDPRGNLFYNIRDILNKKKPYCFLLENVRGLLSNDGGNTFKIILKELNDLHYYTNYKVLNSKDFGLPQNRSRVYIVGFKDLNNFEFPIPKIKPMKVGDILENNIDDKYTISDKLWESHQRRKKENLKISRGFGYSLVDEFSSHTRTLSARYYKDGSEILIKQEGKNPRKLTPREALNLQGFPKSFKINVSDNQAFKQIGNSVSVPVIREIAKEIIHYLKN